MAVGSGFGALGALTQAVLGDHVSVAGMRVEVPGALAIRLSVVGGNLRVQRLMDRVIRGGDTVADVGANIGYNALYAAARVGPAGRVIAIEPAADNLAVLQRNVDANRAEQIRVLPVAAGRQRTRARLYLRGDVSAVNSLFEDSCYAAVTATADVEVVPLDEVIDGPARLVKIDVEGGELDVLAGMPRLLATPDVQLIVEWHPVLQEAAGAAAEDLPRWLLERGFQVDAVFHTHSTVLGAGEIAAMAKALHAKQASIELFARR